MALFDNELKIIKAHLLLDGLKSFLLMVNSTYLNEDDQAAIERIDGLLSGNLNKYDLSDNAFLPTISLVTPTIALQAFCTNLKSYCY